MFIPGGCFCCEPPEDPCVLSGCTWSSTDMSDTDLTAGTAYYNPVSGVNPDGDYEITNAQETGAGNDAPCRKITIETVSAPHKPDTVYAICWKDDATHNPSTQCPLTSVSFCVESKRHGDSDSGLTDSVVFVVRQNNRIFATAAQSVGVNWKRASGTYTQSSFTEIDGAGNPNFTATGTSIEFGFALKLLVSEDEEPLDVVMFDNLCIKISAGCTCCQNCTGEELILTVSGIQSSIYHVNYTQAFLDCLNSEVEGIINSTFIYYRTPSPTYCWDTVSGWTLYGPFSCAGKTFTISLRVDVLGVVYWGNSGPGVRIDCLSASQNRYSLAWKFTIRIAGDFTLSAVPEIIYFANGSMSNQCSDFVFDSATGSPHYFIDASQAAASVTKT